MAPNIKIREIMARKGISQRCLGKLVGCSEVSIHLICTGKTLPKCSIASAVAKALESSIDELWPDYAARSAERNKKISAGLRLHSQKRKQHAEKERGYQAIHALRKCKEQLSIHPTDPNAVPMAVGAVAGDFTLHPVKTPKGQLQNPQWCQDQARRLHNFLAENCAYGVYRELRALFAHENRIF